MYRVLVIGHGGREHALCKKFNESTLVEKVYVAKGNDNMNDVAEVVNIEEDDFTNLVNFAINYNIDLTFVGGETSLCLGIVDEFESHNLKIFGPRKKAAKLEGSKSYCKDLMEKYHIPTAKYDYFSDYETGCNYLDQMALPIVLKADGLAAGKGVYIAKSYEEAKSNLKTLLASNSRVLIEDYLDGEEFSLMAFVNGDKVYPLQIAKDYKKAKDGDLGLNTGGMGAYTPVDSIADEYVEMAKNEILIPMAKALVKENNPFTGILYAGCMKVKNKVLALEFNVRFGDPETEVLLAALESDLFVLANNLLDGKEINLQFSNKYFLGLVIASEGYPEKYQKDNIIENLEQVNCDVIHMGTKLQDDKILSDGGRVLFLLDSGNSLEDARSKVYEEVKKVKAKNLFYRSDIGNI